MSNCIRNTTLQINDLYESCKPALHAIGIRFGYNHEELKDLVNQFFLEMLEKNINFTPIENPEAYISTAFKRKLIDYYRNNKQRLHAGKLYVVENAYEPSVQEALEKIRERSKGCFGMMDSVFEEYDLPVELKYLAVVESELKSDALSPVGAAGPGQ